MHDRIKEYTLHTITAFQLEGLVRCAENAYTSETAGAWLEEICNGKIKIFEIAGIKGFFGVKPVKMNSGRALWVEFAYGKDLVRKHEDVSLALGMLARAYSCDFVSWQTQLKSLNRFLARHNYAAQAVTYRLELPT
jgi:hypothetical protein